jgi:glycerol-3-phosphate dehydrogenase
MGLPKNKLSLTRKDVESGHVGKYTDEDYHLYARHDKPDELLQSDSKFPSGHNPVVGRESKVNK